MSLLENNNRSQILVDTYGKRNWVEVFYREAKGWLGLKEYQVREKRSLTRHFILVFCAYTFILWHQMTGGLRRRWATKPLNTFTEAFRTAMSFRFFDWLTLNRDRAIRNSQFAFSPIADLHCKLIHLRIQAPQFIEEKIKRRSINVQAPVARSGVIIANCELSIANWFDLFAFYKASLEYIWA